MPGRGRGRRDRRRLRLGAVGGPLYAASDAARIRADVDRLAGFGTRHSFSDTVSETRGIGAARRWIEADLRATKRYQTRLRQAKLRLQAAIEIAACTDEPAGGSMRSAAAGRAVHANRTTASAEQSVRRGMSDRTEDGRRSFPIRARG